MGDTGLTGRKIIVDTYGGMGRHGGGAFSGKDPTKVDRSAAYMARHIAKNIVAAGLADRCEVQLAYAIGVADPVSVLVDTFGTGKVDPAIIPDLVRATFQADSEGDHRVAQFAAADLLQDCGLWTLWAQRSGLHLGSDRQSGETGQRCGTTGTGFADSKKLVIPSRRGRRTRSGSSGLLCNQAFPPGIRVF